jgi:(heptosyl)LPS beta-1,4-glucosyltransferase
MEIPIIKGVEAAQTRRPARISLVVNTLNEEKNIAACIQSVGDFADEVVVCDMYSEDRTCEIAESLGARVILHKREPYVEKARRFAIEQARGEWILLLDADERTTPELLAELNTLMNRSDVNVVLLRWRFLFMGRFLKYGAWSATTLFRFFKRDKYLEATPLDSDATLHTGRSEALRTIAGQILARERFTHLAYPTLDKYVRKTLHHYSIHEARDRYEKLGERPNLARLVYWPTRAFIASYIYRLGFLDGIQGLIASLMWAQLRFLVAAHLYDLDSKRTDDEPWVGIVALPKGHDVSMEKRPERVNS